MAEFPALPLWTDAYLGDTIHLSTMAHGAYLLLLITAWRTRDCSLPDDDRLLARYARCTLGQWKKLRPELEGFFEISRGKWIQGRLIDEFQTVRRKKQSAAANGRASALKRLGRHSTKRNASDEQDANEHGNEMPTDESTDAQRKSNLTISNSIPPKSSRSKSSEKTRFVEGWEPEPFGDGTQCRTIVDGWSRLEFERQLERFSAHHSAAGSRFADWQAAWKTWVLNSVDFGHGRGGRKPASSEPGDFVDSVLADAQAAKVKR